MVLSLTASIKNKARKLGFQKIGIARATATLLEQEHLEAWLDSGRHASMGWMVARRRERGDLQKYFPQAKSIISVGLNYFTGFHQTDLNSIYKFSNYAWGTDYHLIIKSKLLRLLAWIREQIPELKGIVCVDTSPVMEKTWAQRAGLGWQGKHTNLITREFGSWLFLGELIVDVDLQCDPIFNQDLCGTCTACIDACPTQALTEYQIDAGKCISYLTIEHRGTFCEDTPPLHGWIYGCDICQEVCPWNIRFARKSHLKEFLPRSEILKWQNQDWEQIEEEGFRKLFRDSAVRRTKLQGLKRNILRNRSLRQNIVDN